MMTSVTKMVDKYCEIIFHINRRESSISLEVYCGVIQFLSSLYLVIALPKVLADAGYDINLASNVIVSAS